MPELPEVETTIRGLEAVMTGQRLVSVEPRRADLRRPIPVDLRQRMTGARIVGLSRRAKYGMFDTDRGDTMIFHLGMSGRWRIDPEDLGMHDHLVIDMESGHRVVLCDPRRFGSIDLVETAQLDNFPAFVSLGPEPLGPDFTAEHLGRVLAGRHAPIKALLLDQRIVAGLGNIYVCEALHMAGIAPGTQGRRLGSDRRERLVAAIRSVLEAAILAGGSSLRDYARPDGELGYFAKSWRAYGREGQPCQCGLPIRRRVDGGRSTFYCPRCQR